MLAFVEYSPNYIYNLEKKIESENLIVNPEIRNVINQKRKEGFAICFISDMYLDSQFLKDVLLRKCKFNCFAHAPYLYSVMSVCEFANLQKFYWVSNSDKLIKMVHHQVDQCIILSMDFVHLG